MPDHIHRKDSSETKPRFSQLQGSEFDQQRHEALKLRTWDSFQSGLHNFCRINDRFCIGTPVDEIAGDRRGSQEISADRAPYCSNLQTCNLETINSNKSDRNVAICRNEMAFGNEFIIYGMQVTKGKSLTSVVTPTNSNLSN